jgi:hypothetical protein
MKNLPHILVVALAIAAPVFFQAMANGPLTWATAGQAVLAGLTALVGVLLKSPLAVAK